MTQDISQLLDEWPPDAPPVRLIEGTDGHMRIQRRVALGILQFHVDGRPDGTRPNGSESLYTYLLERSRVEPDFHLTHDDCQSLAAEALLFFQRRLCCFELGDFRAAARDARRNLRVFAFVRRYACDESDASSLDRYRGFVVFHRARAEALQALNDGDLTGSLDAIDCGIQEIEAFREEYDMDEQEFDSEEIQSLTSLRRKIEDIRPRNRSEILKDELQSAIDRELYERAAELRDQIRALE